MSKTPKPSTSRTFAAAAVIAATGATRDDLINWSRNGLLTVPLADSRPGKARRYCAAGILEIALLKAMIERGSGFRLASDAIAEYVNTSTEPLDARSSLDTNAPHLFWAWHPSGDGDAFETTDDATALQWLCEGLVVVEIRSVVERALASINA